MRPKLASVRRRKTTMPKGEPRLHSPPPSRSRWIQRGLAVLVAMIATTVFIRSIDPGIQFGVLGSTCAPERVNALKRTGVDLAQVDVLWDRLEPVPGRVDHGYAAELATTIETCRDSGIEVILGLGLQYAPDWVSRLPNGEYLDQTGNVNPTRVPNVVFSPEVREAFTNHAIRVLGLLPEGSVHAIRLGTSEAGELGYPGAGEDGMGPETGFWAFNETARTGAGLPPGINQGPLPGWKPGDRTWRGHDLTADQVANWFRWYSEAATEAVLWQADMLRDVGYVGNFHVPLAGRGTLPRDLRQALASELDGTGDRDGSLERGLYYPEQLQALKDGIGTGDLVADITALDDATAVQARIRQPGADTCNPDDQEIDLIADTDVDRWSAARWTIANARKAGLDVIGENPGSPYASGTGGAAESDDLQNQMVHAPRYAAECGLSAFLWAFEDDLFGDPQKLTVDDYRAAISAYK
ncbi:Uncharacterised protein [Kocuria rosea]|nr:Uncharacterised protein [Kocuria rosea]